ncbi:MAG: hypothetical protein DI640_14630 [Sphingomonas taxi]|uniref:DUF1468 domain-containing protein n=1 Tax=Sphingomonas taxi TaxID=1549858 RepID=A0A2W5AST4_9SPHN|nr:MAG: hypothetical protein DI640_14630 [Sphingomonas taxi]
MNDRNMALLTDRLLAVGLFAASVVAATMAGDYHRGAGLFPTLVACMLALCAVALFLRTLFGRSYGAEISQIGVERVGAERLAGFVAAMIVYAFLMPRLGFVTTTLVFVGGVSFAFGLRNWRWLIFGTIAFTIGVQWLFRGVFNVQLPRDWFWRFF